MFEQPPKENLPKKEEKEEKPQEPEKEEKELLHKGALEESFDLGEENGLEKLPI